MTNNFSVRWGNGDISLDFNADKNFEFIKMKAKFMDYFKFATVSAEGKWSNAMNSCEDDCGMDMGKNFCCASIEMYGKESQKNGIMYQCMDNAVADVGQGMWLDEYYFEYECQKGSWNSNKDMSDYRFNSGASFLIAGAVSVLSVSAALY